MMKFMIISTSGWGRLLDVYKKRLTDAGFRLSIENDHVFIYIFDAEEFLMISDITENELIIRKDHKETYPTIEIYDDWRE